jgi:hypothetical protein
LPAVKMFATAIEGRWDLTINENGKEKPAWLDVRHSGLKTLVGYFVASSGSARPVSKVNFANENSAFPFRRNGKWA